MIDTLVKIALVFGGFIGALILGGVYVLFWPEKAEKVAGWIATGVARLWRRADKTAVALRIQSDINKLSASIHRDSPTIIDKKLKIEWNNAEEAEARVRGGNVVVFMRDSRRHEENLATAVMAFIPKALIPLARRYVEHDTMRAIDLTVVKALLTTDDATEGALDVFYERHLDPARANSDRLKQKIAEMDEIDVHGYLSRILITEYRRVGGRLYPAVPDQACLEEAEELADWLYKIASKKKNEHASLTFRGRYFNVAVLLVADRVVLGAFGVEPYRKRAKRYIYTDKFDSVYLLARDPNIPAVDELLEALAGDALVQSSTRHAFRLRQDFAARLRLRREYGICVCLRRKQEGGEVFEESDEDVSVLPVEDHQSRHAPEVPAEPEIPDQAPQPARGN